MRYQNSPLLRPTTRSPSSTLPSTSHIHLSLPRSRFVSLPSLKMDLDLLPLLLLLLLLFMMTLLLFLLFPLQLLFNMIFLMGDIDSDFNSASFASTHFWQLMESEEGYGKVGTLMDLRLGLYGLIRLLGVSNGGIGGWSGACEEEYVYYPSINNSVTLTTQSILKSNNLRHNQRARLFHLQRFRLIILPFRHSSRQIASHRIALIRSFPRRRHFPSTPLPSRSIHTRAFPLSIPDSDRNLNFRCHFLSSRRSVFWYCWGVF